MPGPLPFGKDHVTAALRATGMFWFANILWYLLTVSNLRLNSVTVDVRTIRHWDPNQRFPALVNGVNFLSELPYSPGNILMASENDTLANYSNGSYTLSNAASLGEIPFFQPGQHYSYFAPIDQQPLQYVSGTTQLAQPLHEVTYTFEFDLPQRNTLPMTNTATNFSSQALSNYSNSTVTISWSYYTTDNVATYSAFQWLNLVPSLLSNTDAMNVLMQITQEQAQALHGNTLTPQQAQQHWWTAAIHRYGEEAFVILYYLYYLASLSYAHRQRQALIADNTAENNDGSNTLLLAEEENEPPPIRERNASLQSEDNAENNQNDYDPVFLAACVASGSIALASMGALVATWGALALILGTPILGISLGLIGASIAVGLGAVGLFSGGKVAYNQIETLTALAPQL